MLSKMFPLLKHRILLINIKISAMSFSIPTYE
jgi:hypothetical protein